MPKVWAQTPADPASQFAVPPGPVSGQPNPVSAAGGLGRVRPWDSFWTITIATCGLMPQDLPRWNRMLA